MRPDQPALLHLTETIDGHLAGIAAEKAAEKDGIAEVRQALGRFRDGIADRAAEIHPAAPRCAHFDDALALTARQSGEAIAAAIAAAMPVLNWITYDLYPVDEIGAYFPKQHAFASLASPYDPNYARDFDLGLFLIEPHTLYRDHNHRAAELYLPLTGPTRWRFGPDTDWFTRAAGEPVWNPPYQKHATLVDDVPLLCVYGWTKDVHHPAQVVRARDWPSIETKLAANRS